MSKSLLGTPILLFACSLASAQDMPLSQIVKDGEGWRELARGFPTIDRLLERPPASLRVLHAKGEDIVSPDGKRRPVPGQDDETELRHPQQVRTRAGQMFVIRGDHPPGVFHHKGKSMEALDTRPVRRPSGLALALDESTLVVGDADGKYLWAFRIEKDGRLGAGEPYYAMRVRRATVESGVTVLTTDSAGRIYACTPLGIQVFDPTGRLCGVLLKPGPGDLTAIAFAGEDRDRLFVACGDTIYARKMLAKGAAPKE